MYDIILVNPIKIRDSYVMLPLGTLTLATILEENHINVKIVDFNYLWEKKLLDKEKNIKALLEEMCDYLLGLSPGIIGFSTNSSCHHVAIELARLLKEKGTPKVIFGGHQASLCAIETMNQFPWIDLVSVGEGEYNIVPITKALLNNEPLDQIPGIVFRESNMIISTGEAKLMENLDLLPMLHYDLIPMDIETNRANKIAFPIEVGRSCPFQCTFCCTKTFWKQKPRMKSTERLISEIEFIIEKYGIYDFHFLHDLFTFHQQKVIDFCKQVIAKQLPIRWICSIRVDTVNESLIRIMKEAGCQKVFLGIETASAKLQKVIRKNLNISNIWEKVQLLQKYHIKVEAGFMYGFPEEEEEDLNQTLNMMLRGAGLGYWFPEIGVLNVENGTEIHDQIKDRLYIKKNLDNIYLCGYEEFEYFYPMFSKHKDIFPHFCDFDSITRQQYAYLDRFVWILVSMLFLGFKTSISMLIKLYENNILAIYTDLVTECSEKFQSIFVENFAVTNSTDRDSIEKRIDLLSTFAEIIAQKKEYGSVITEIFELDQQIVMLRLYGEIGECVELNFQYDLLQIKQSGKMNTDIGKYRIILEKKEGNRIKMDGFSKNIQPVC